MTSTTRTRTLAAALLAAVGIAAPAAAQQSSSSSTTSITYDDGKTSTVVRSVVDGVEYRVELKDGKVTKATADGLEVDHKREGNTIVLLDGGNEFTLRLPKTNQQAFVIGGRGQDQNRFAWAPDAERVFPGGGQIAQAFAQPKTMVGLTQNSVGSQLREHLGLDEDEGMVVVSVVDGLPAEEAGLQAGDVMIEIDGEPVEGSRTLTRALADREPGDLLGVVVLRKGSPVSLEIEVAEYDAEKLNAFPMGIRGGNLFAPDGQVEWEFDADNLPQLEGLRNLRPLNLEGLAELEHLHGLEGLEGLEDIIQHRLRFAEEQMAEAHERAAEAQRRVELLVRPGGQGRPFVIEEERASQDQAEELRRARDEMYQAAWDLVDRLADAAEGDDERELEELTDKLAEITSSATSVHRHYERIRRDGLRSDHPMYDRAEDLRRARDDANRALRDMARSLERQLDRAESADQRRSVLKKLRSVAERGRANHFEYEKLRRETQQSPARVRPSGSDVNDRIEALEDKLDRILDALDAKDSSDASDRNDR